MANKTWKVQGALNITGLLPIKLDDTNAASLDQGIIETHMVSILPTATFNVPLGAFTRVRSLVLVSDLPLTMVIDGGTSVTKVRTLVEWAQALGVLVTSTMTLTNPSTTLTANITLVVGGDPA